MKEAKIITKEEMKEIMVKRLNSLYNEIEFVEQYLKDLDREIKLEKEGK